MPNSKTRGVAYDDPSFTELTVTGNAAIGDAITDTLAFYGVTPITQRAGAAQTQISPASLATSLAGFGFYTATLAASLVAQVEEIRAALVAYGLFKGGA